MPCAKFDSEGDAPECPVCGDTFRKEFNDESNEWDYVEAVLRNEDKGRVSMHHPWCTVGLGSSTVG